MDNQQNRKVIVVTGSNKGIGYSMIDQIFSKHPEEYQVVMTSRNQARGEAAIATMIEKHPDSKDHLHLALLDLLDLSSIDNFVAHLKEKFQQIDYIVNNAAVLLWDENEENTKIQWNTNYKNTRLLTEKLLDQNLINQHGKIIMVSSGAGEFNKIKNQ